MISAYRQFGSFETKRVGCEWVIFNMNKQTVTRLNEMGAFCWSLLANTQTIDSVIDAINDKFQLGCSQETVRKDLEDFLFDLLRFNMIRHVD